MNRRPIGEILRATQKDEECSDRLRYKNCKGVFHFEKPWPFFYYSSGGSKLLYMGIKMIIKIEKYTS